MRLTKDILNTLPINTPLVCNDPANYEYLKDNKILYFKGVDRGETEFITVSHSLDYIGASGYFYHRFSLVAPKFTSKTKLQD